MNFLSKNIPYFLDRTDYERIDSIIIKENIIKQLGYDRNILGSIQGSIMKGVISNDPLLISSELLAGLNSFRMNEQFTVSDGYIYTADGKEAIVRIESGFPLSETANNKVLINIIDKIAKTLKMFTMMSLSSHLERHIYQSAMPIKSNMTV